MTTEYRAPRVWHLEQRYGRFYVVNQFGGFALWHNDREAAERQMSDYVAKDGDTAPELDTASSASRQHYIDTGRYLRPGEADS